MLMLTGESADDFAFILRALKSYQEKTGVSAKASAPYDSANSRLRLLQDLFARRSTEPDICAIDNVWPGLLADDLVDLKPYLGDEMTAIDRSLLEAFTVKGRLVALPEFLEAPVLYYRSDLLHKYGYKEPPETWDDLTRMATVIQDGERKAGAANFWGYVWEGAEGEALNCNALEWQQAEGANLIDNSGAVCPLNPSAESAVRRARSWVGTISPPSVYEYDEDDVYNVWLAGSAAFARGWLAAYESSKKSPYLAAGFGTAHMPAGSKGYAWTFGGMGLAVSKYSHNQQAAAQVVRYLTSSAIQRQRLIASSAIPTRTDLLSNTALLQETAFGGWLSVHWRQGMLYRPSAVMGEKYSSIARAYSKAIHNAISGKQDTHEALTNLHTELIGMTHK
jgi:trehalose/maltose transport system substrate-binding protein